MNFNKRFLVSCMVFIMSVALIISGCSKSPSESGSTEPENQPVAEDTWERIKQEGKFVVGLDDAFALLVFATIRMELVGFDIDLGEL